MNTLHTHSSSVSGFPDSPADLKGGPRIDPKFVNNPDLSDIQFRVEGKIFYAHKGGRKYTYSHRRGDRGGF
jgi:hypothetical protein